MLKFFPSRKGQGAGSAAALVGAIVGLIILYILFIPPEDRAELLGENNTKPGISKGIAEDSRVLLDVYPGTLYKTKQTDFEHKINSFNLYTRDEGRIIKQVDSVTIETTSGTTQDRKVSFSVDPSKVSNAQLSFAIGEGSGRLIIVLNDNEIFNADVGGQIALPVSLNSDNILEFRTEKVGFMFWKRNYYMLKDVKISGVMKVSENLESRQSFIVGLEEARNVDSAYLTYFVDCRLADSGNLKVYINSALLYSTTPDCGSPVKLQMEPGLITAGTNTVRFAADQGSFLIDQVFVKTKLREPIEPIYYFEVNNTKFAWLQNNTFNAVLKMKLVDDSSEKRAELNINNRKTFMDAKRTSNFTRVINSFIVEGNNFIKIIPEKTFDIVQLTVKLE